MVDVVVSSVVVVVVVLSSRSLNIVITCLLIRFLLSSGTLFFMYNYVYIFFIYMPVKIDW